MTPLILSAIIRNSELTGHPKDGNQDFKIPANRESQPPGFNLFGYATWTSNVFQTVQTDATVVYHETCIYIRAVENSIRNRSKTRTRTMTIEVNCVVWC